MQKKQKKGLLWAGAIGLGLFFILRSRKKTGTAPPAQNYFPQNRNSRGGVNVLETLDTASNLINDLFGEGGTFTNKNPKDKRAIWLNYLSTNVPGNYYNVENFMAIAKSMPDKDVEVLYDYIKNYLLKSRAMNNSIKQKLETINRTYKIFDRSIVDK
jgi:hypothetical protein